MGLFDARCGWKGDRPWVRLERTGEFVRSPKITSGDKRLNPCDSAILLQGSDETLSCFAQFFPSISFSSVFTEQWRICVEN